VVVEVELKATVVMAAAGLVGKKLVPTQSTQLKILAAVAVVLIIHQIILAATAVKELS